MKLQYDNLLVNYIMKMVAELSKLDGVICVPVNPVGGITAHNLILR